MEVIKMELKKYKTEKPNQKRIKLLQTCKFCIFFNSCFFIPEDSNCKRLLKTGKEMFLDGGK